MRAAALLALLALAFGPRLWAEGPAPAAPGKAVTPTERDEAIARALRPLDEDMPKRFSSYEQEGVFAGAIAGWAFLLLDERPEGAAGLASRAKSLARIAGQVGTYLEKVERFVKRGDRKPVKPAPMDPMDPMGSFNDGIQCNWPTAAAGLFFAEALQRGKLRKEAKPAAERALRILEATQQENGGWGHDDARRGGVSGMTLPIPDPTGRHAKLDYPGTLLSTSNLGAAALGALTRALRKEGAESVARARAYYAAAQNGDGSFPYDPSQTRRAGPEAPAGLGPADLLAAPLAAGALFALRSLGVPAEDPVAARARSFVDAHPEGLSEGHGSATYGLMLGALEASSRSEPAWRSFRARFLRRVLDAQAKDGTFACACAHGSFGTICDTEPLPGGIDFPGHAEDGRMYVTALHTLILALDRVPLRCLPPPAKATPAAVVTPK